MNFISAIGLVGGFVTTMSGVPQIYHMYNTRDTKGVGWGMLSMWGTGLSMTTFYGIALKQPPIWVSSSTSLLMTIIMGGIKYRCERVHSYEQV